MLASVIGMLCTQSGVMKTVLKKSCPVETSFSRQNSKVDNLKIKRNVSLFPLHSLLIFLFFLLSLSLSFFIARSDFKVLKSGEIKMYMGDLVQSIDMVFINPVIYVKQDLNSSIVTNYDSRQEHVG